MLHKNLGRAALCYFTLKQYNHSVNSYCTIIMYTHTVQSYSTPIMCTNTEHWHWTLMLYTYTVFITGKSEQNVQTEGRTYALLPLLQSDWYWQNSDPLQTKNYWKSDQFGHFLLEIQTSRDSPISCFYDYINQEWNSQIVIFKYIIDKVQL